MNNNDKIENTLRSAVSNAVPDVLGGIMDACDQQKGKVIYMEKKKNNTLRSVAAIAAVFVLLIAGIFLAKNFQGGSSGTLAAVVSFDVNPSIELSVDKNEKVLSAVGLNDDGREVLDGMELKDTDLDVAVNAIVGSMLQHGYLDDMANSILLSVSGVDGYDADTLQAKLTESVNKLLKDCSVLSQNVSDADDDLVEKAEKYGITVGKAKLITEIVAGDSRHNFEELVGLTIISRSSSITNTASWYTKSSLKAAAPNMSTVSTPAAAISFGLRTKTATASARADLTSYTRIKPRQRLSDTPDSLRHKSAVSTPISTARAADMYTRLNSNAAATNTTTRSTLQTAQFSPSTRSLTTDESIKNPVALATGFLNVSKNSVRTS